MDYYSLCHDEVCKSVKGNYIQDNHQLLSIWKEVTIGKNKCPQKDCGLLEGRGCILNVLSPLWGARTAQGDIT